MATCRLPHDLTIRARSGRRTMSARIFRHDRRRVRAALFGAVAERLLHSPRKRASERTWGFESLPLRTDGRSPSGQVTWGAFLFKEGMFAGFLGMQ